MPRPLMYLTAIEIEKFVRSNSAEMSKLLLALDELSRRKTNAARDTKLLAESLLAGLSNVTHNTPIDEFDNTPAEVAAVGQPAEVSELEGDDDDILDDTLRVLDGLPNRSEARAEEETASSGEPSSRSEQEAHWTLSAISNLRKKLIDLSKRNPLIAFKHSHRGASHLRIVDERPDLLFSCLSKGQMGFEPLPDQDQTPADEQTPNFQIKYESARLSDQEFLDEIDGLGDDESDAKAWQEAERKLRARIREALGLPKLEYGKTVDVKALAKAHGFDPSFDLKNSDVDSEEHHEDDKIRVLLTEKELSKQLKTIWERYRSHERETGLHTLFLVFGFVQWYEDDSSDVALHAPLLLLPVSLNRVVKHGRYQYMLSSNEEGLEVNIALAEKMRQSFGLELPQLREEETPESFFIRTEQVLAHAKRISLRRFATLAVLPFPRMVLWKDLDPSLWPENAFSDHSLLPILLGARDSEGSSKMEDTHDIEAEPWASIAPPLIQPADASQHSALIDIAAGKSIAIEGPPGTGKSQTITNMIATALSSGKKVLFVAEKQAALSVVAGRLRQAGFGPLLLEMHSEGASRTGFFDSLKARVEAVANSRRGELDEKRARLTEKRNLIRKYMALIRTPLGAVGRSAHWLVWREVRLRSGLPHQEILEASENWRIESPDLVTRLDLDGVRTHLTSFSQALAAVDEFAVSGERTRWVFAPKLSPFDQLAERTLARQAAKAALDLHDSEQSIVRDSALDMTVVIEELLPATEQLASLPDIAGIDDASLRSASRQPDNARALLHLHSQWSQMQDELTNDVEDVYSISGAMASNLSVSLDNIENLPEEKSGLVIRSDIIKNLIQKEKDFLDVFAGVLQEIGVNNNFPVQKLKNIIDVIIKLEAVNTEIACFFNSDLLGSLAQQTLKEEQLQAEAIRKTRQELDEHFLPRAFDQDPDELKQVSEDLENTGLLSRLFGGRYRAAKRVAGKLAAGDFDRIASAQLLSELESYLRKAKDFHDQSYGKNVFPPALWRGADSRWSDLLSAQAYLVEASQKSLLLGMEDLVPSWLSKPELHRRARVNALKKVVDFLSQSIEVGIVDAPVSEIFVLLNRDMTLVDNALEALDKVKSKPDARLIFQGKKLGDRLTCLIQIEEQFNSISSTDLFKWAGHVSENIDTLARALIVFDQLAALDGPLRLAAAIAETEFPLALLNRIQTEHEGYRQKVESWLRIQADLEAKLGVSAAVLAQPFSTWLEFGHNLDRLADDEAGARLAADLVRYRMSLDEVNCSYFAEAALEKGVCADHLADLYELLLVRALLSEYLGGEGSELGRLGSLTLEDARRIFVKLDKELHDLEARAIVEQRLGDSAPNGISSGPKSGWTERSLLDHQLSLKRPSMPIRGITKNAGRALQALKPVWMMSPTSAAQFIRPGSLVFDLLIMDEASQMRPEFAVSAIMRGKQFVVVGDTNQLPPTDFFSIVNQSDDDDGADDMSVDTESILDLANSRFRYRRRLKWHYRSQHESLIQFSNRQFYERDLMVFPSPTVEDDLLGVKHSYVNGTYEASINQKEAEAIIEETFRLICAYPENSIGIATMNAKQTELIRNEFDRLMLENPEVRDYVDRYAGGIEEFFIKNLENVQGDERDIILISTVYGPDKLGNVRQNFGPINRDVGWRRLNVLVTRAKRSTRIFTSLRPSDIKITANSSRGLIALQAYLTYAERGAQFDEGSGGEPDSDFEIFVADALRDAGYEVVYQVGVDGFRIDLGVKHSDFPAGFIAGIECDGATYHTGLTVRDRDRIRQSILESLGWNIYRVWSTDWFGDPSRETAKLLAQLEVWRAAAAQDYAKHPTESDQVKLDEKVASSPEGSGDPAMSFSDAAEVSHSPEETSTSREERPTEPRGRPMRPLDNIEWYEAHHGWLYEVWVEGQFIGSVEVLSRATNGPRVYGDRFVVQKSEYEGWIASTGERFKNHDIHAAVRRVGSAHSSGVINA